MQIIHNDGPTSHHGLPLRVEGAWKSFPTRSGGKVTPVRDVSFSVEAGQFVSLVGPSGCGKTTMLSILAGLYQADEGTVTIGGAPVAEPSSTTAMVFQQPRLLPWRTVADNLLLVKQVAGYSKRSARRQFRDKVHELLGLVGLQHVADEYPQALSGGMQQRVGVVRALVDDPKVLLMDEPFAALDAFTRDEMGLELLRIWERTRQTVVFVTHSLPEAVLLSDSVICLGTHSARSVVANVPVPLDRPRRLEDTTTDEFLHLVAELRKVLFDDIRSTDAAEQRDAAAL